ncbi:metal-dependent hydrolase [Scytonema sp. UIC 10036]|uniref:metal-dependent hydrolase n=1 Tax=Scytonema sp. UIC 10036 TaxID=2304196 RepID=UPI0012DAC819|nr:metal-dependent hydrolase [Scytonema sp. UIC 10036]MUG91056.1 metal-dependent hydrolase [Scytonema sp. UIC 10036]
MMGITHLVISATATSLLLQTADARLIVIGAAASLLPDIDTCTSYAGRIFSPVSRFLRQRLRHRGATHSLYGSSILAIFSYPIVVLTPVAVDFIHALNIGYFFGYFADIFTVSGCQLFWPSKVRVGWPENREFRLKTNSPAESALVIMLLIILMFSLTVNSSGGMMTYYNRLVGSISGVEQLYNQHGWAHLIITHIEGFRSSDRTKVVGNFLLVESHSQGFLVLSKDGKVYKAGTEPDSQIITERITADVGQIAITNIESLTLDDENLKESLARFYRPRTLMFVSGKLKIDDPEDIELIPDLHQFPFIQLNGSSVKLETAPLDFVAQKLGNQFATGQLLIRSIAINETLKI